MLLGIVLHAAVSYMPGRMPGLYWGVYDDHHPGFDVLFWWIHSFRLPLFFVVAGFFAAMLLELRGRRRFLRQRVRRLLLPFLVGSLLVVPASFIYAWISRLVTGAPTDQTFTAFLLDPAMYGELLGPMHLWFLEDLLILSVLYVGVAWIANRWGRTEFPWVLSVGHVFQRVTCKARWKTGPTVLWPAVLAVPTAAMLCVDLRVFTEHHNSFVPDVGRLAYYGYCFAIGHRSVSALRPTAGDLWGAARPPRIVADYDDRHAGAAAGVFCRPSWAGSGSWVLRCVVALQVWLTIFALMGMALAAGAMAATA